MMYGIRLHASNRDARAFAEHELRGTPVTPSGAMHYVGVTGHHNEYRFVCSMNFTIDEGTLNLRNVFSSGTYKSIIVLLHDLPQSTQELIREGFVEGVEPLPTSDDYDKAWNEMWVV